MKCIDRYTSLKLLLGYSEITGISLDFVLISDHSKTPKNFQQISLNALSFQIFCF